MGAKGDHEKFMRQALALAQKAYGDTSPNPMVGAVLVRSGKIIGKGYHRAAGQPHAEIEALNDAQRRGERTKGADLYVTLEPCSSYGRTPPCTEAIVAAGIKRVFIAAIDPNPQHKGAALEILRNAGLKVTTGILEAESTRLNEAFNHWVVHRRPFVTAKCAMTLDGKIATAEGESKWITGPEARDYAMHLRRGADAILVGVNTVIHDDPQLNIRPAESRTRPIHRLVLDPRGRVPLSAKLLNDGLPTTIVMGERTPKKRQDALAAKDPIMLLNESEAGLDLSSLLNQLGDRDVTSLLVEGGGETLWTFFKQELVQRVVFFYAPKVLGGRDARKAVSGEGFLVAAEAPKLREVEWSGLGKDLMLSALVHYS
jgi:diaminohydroxyphosphoribosylaminopyrimidine deaminase/5-amino-6-(5-phosphoribosylamino)uracil reductase